MKVTRHQAQCYHVSNGYDGAAIFLRHWPRDDGGSSGYISVVGSFGEFGHYFGNCGGDFRAFLCGCHHGYLTTKFFGVEARVFDCDATVIVLKRLVCDRRRKGRFDTETAREMWNAVKDADGSNTSDVFFTRIQDAWGSYFWDAEVYSMGETVMNPQAKGFFEDIWPGFVAELQSELAAIAA